jgi:hypothetical protein
MCQRRPSGPLKDGAHMVLNHALRGRCPKCNRIYNWNDADEQGVVTGECCKIIVRLFPWSVKVRFESTRPESLLPPHRESLFPTTDLMDHAVEPAPPADPQPSAP